MHREKSTIRRNTQSPHNSDCNQLSTQISISRATPTIYYPPPCAASGSLFPPRSQNDCSQGNLRVWAPLQLLCPSSAAFPSTPAGGGRQSRLPDIPIPRSSPSPTPRSSPSPHQPSDCSPRGDCSAPGSRWDASGTKAAGYKRLHQAIAPRITAVSGGGATRCPRLSEDTGTAATSARGPRPSGSSFHTQYRSWEFKAWVRARNTSARLENP